MAPTAVAKDDILRELRQMKGQLQTRYGLTRLGVFGSVARGEATPASDLDIVVEMQPNLFRRAALKAELETRLGMPVDVVRYRKNMNNHLKQRIDREALYV